MRIRILAALATIAALTGAPPIASGVGNSLASPSASPTSGTVTTIFTLHVSYDDNWPATAVTVSVAGRTLSLTRIDGTAERGTWSVATVLPAGTWTPRFSALVAGGNAPTIVGPTVTVAGPPVAATPAPAVTNTLPSGGDETEAEAPSGSGDPPGTIVPDPAPAPAPEDAEPSASPGAEPAGSIPATPGTGASRSGSGSGPGSGPGNGPGTSAGGASRTTSSPSPGVPEGGTGGEAPAAPSNGPDAMPSAAPGAMPAAERASADEPEAAVVDDAMLDIVLLVGLSGVATVAIMGTTLLLFARHRSDEEEVPATAAEIGDTDALLERRTVRRAKTRLADDPIVTAMGVDDQVAARRRRSASGQVGSGQVGSGQGERPVRRR